MSQESAPAAAVELKNRGNTFFRTGKVTEASKCYAEAERLCPTDPTYASNLSASLFEEGDYVSCAMAIDRWCQLEGSKSLKDTNLGQRLSGRLAKALNHGVRSGSVSPDLLRDFESTLLELQCVAQKGKPELRQLWVDWDRIAAEAGDRDENVAAARARFSALPIFRKAPKSVLQYHNIGQDPLMSLIDDWGPGYQTPVNVQNMSDEEISRLAFLLGGVGDARHVYSTLVGLHRAHQKMDEKRQGAFRVHITLLDIHPAPLARDLCMILLLDEMITAGDNSIVKAELLSTMFYTFAGVVMPGYCYNRLARVMEDLKLSLEGVGRKLPSWIHIDSRATSKIIPVLDFWSSVQRKFSTKATLLAHEMNSPNLAPEYRAQLEARTAGYRTEVMDLLGSMTPAQLRNMGIAPPSQTASPTEKHEYATRRAKVIESVSTDCVIFVMDNNGNMMFERFWYNVVKAFVPAPILWSRHPGTELFRRMGQGPLPSRVLNKVGVALNIEDTWKPNPTLFDPAEAGLPNLILDPFEAPGYIDLFNQRFGISSTTDDDRPDAPSYGNFVDLFEKVAAALSSLKGQVKFEFLCGELTQELSKMRFGGDDTRPADLPRIYTRGHLNNVPDYTHGTLSTIIYALPVVEEVSSNCFLNCGIFAGDEEFIHTYTLLKSVDVPRYLGCEFTRLKAIDELVILRKQNLPLPLNQLASRVELVTWLSRVLIYTLIPSSSPLGQFRARLPNNLVAFIALLLHLRGVGYPAHWLSEFLQTMLSGSLVTEIAPYTNTWPIPVSDINRRVSARAVRLDPWTAELETILATGLQAIPFAVPDLGLRYTEIGTFEATVQGLHIPMGTLLGTPAPEDPVVCLLFHKLSLGITADRLVERLPQILNGAGAPEPGTLCVLTAQEAVEVPVIRWKLSKARVAQMQEEGWTMVAYRTDIMEACESLVFVDFLSVFLTRLLVTTPVSADQWREV
ncbi:hypothetical protein C8F04DRAFT_953716 [Mycena alexandri]|uniref:DUF4470 domain-containing protein n=1 Tax=Mycena alexandri TaxID=1745969 RepID=A0AAD6T0K6_9AGAR|nr:hypothetical protein C8F04DRAFT_953716 [Mycena alexandri]